MGETIASRVFDADSRINKLIWIPAIGGDSLSDDFRDFCEDLPENGGHPLYEQLPFLAGVAVDATDPESVAEAFATHATPGFLFLAATPVPIDVFGEGGRCWSSSWGYTRIAWLYAANEAEMGERLIGWALEVRDTTLAALRAKQAGAPR